ncbi:MAG TPA: xanthine dehydrogenase family protein molybdopterin-binding subunit [Thermomicrobiales bacterium]|nr:xanthine dehydrogenase family protein molybdopterin-binding subunit [Thermomicrobiales bacterium]
MATTYKTIGKRTKRIDSPPKLTGREKFAGDLRFPGMLRAKLIGSDYGHAKIVSVDALAALAVPGVAAVLTHDDLPVVRSEEGASPISILADGEALYVGHPVAMVLAETDQAARDAADLVTVEYEELEVIVDLEAAAAEDAPSVSHGAVGNFAEEAEMHNADAGSGQPAAEDLPPNVSNAVDFQRGNLEKGLAEADEIVEFDFTSDVVHQGYIEPQVALAVPELGRLTIYTSTQAAFHGRQETAESLGVDLDDIKIVPMPVGGGFGGKFVLIEPLVAAAAKAVDRPVLLQFTREDDFLTGNPAPDCKIHVKLGAKRDGTLTALDAFLLFDCGAGSGSPLSIAAILLGGYYRFPNLSIKGYEVQTHRPSSGSYRAPGAQQASFAIESAMDEMAHKLELDPLEFRLQNCVVEGDERPNGAHWPRIGLKETLEALREHPIWKEREQRRASGHGIGLAVGGWPGGIEPATAACRLDSDGKLTVMLGSVDLNGTNTTFGQVAAESLGVSSGEVRVRTADTDSAPFAGGTGGSKVTYTVGAAVRKAADDAVEQIKQIAAEQLEASVEDLELVDGFVRVRGVPESGISLEDVALASMKSGGHGPVLGRGASSISQIAPGFAAHLAEVAVDEVTGKVKVVNYAAAQDVGFAINPAAVEGQIHGGVAQGIGWALYEGIHYGEDGSPDASSLLDYTLPRAEMIPPIEVLLVEVESEHGPYGAKGVGEPPAIPGPAVIANAIRDGIGARITDIPIRPAAVLEAIPE